MFFSSFSFQIIISAAFLIVVIWWSGRGTRSTSATSKSLPDLRAHLSVNDHQLLAEIKEVEALVADWSAGEIDSEARDQGVDGLCLLSSSLQRRQSAYSRQLSYFDEADAQVRDEITKMRAWMLGRLNAISASNAEE